MMARGTSYLYCAAWVAAVVLAAPLGRAADTIEAGPFSVDVAPALMIRLNGAPLITGSRCVGFRGTTANSPVLVDAAQGTVTRKDNVFTSFAHNGRNTLRQEVMVTAEAVHITYEVRALGPTGGSHVEYDLLAPVEALDGVPCTWTSGAPRDHRADKEAVLRSKETKAGEYAQRSVVYARFAFPSGACTMDFNPQGAWQDESNYGEPTAVTLWHDGRLWHLMSLCSGGVEGATVTGKIILRAGSVPYEQVHSRAPVSYTSEFPVALALNFSESDSDARYAACPADVPAGRPWRWQDPKSVRIIAREKGGTLYRDFAAPARKTGEVVFDMEQPSGLYLLTAHVHDADATTGPFTVTGPDGALFTDVRVPRGKQWIKTVPLRFRDGKASLRLTGDWKLNALTLQNILGDGEDFLFARPFWNMALPADVAP